MNRSARNTEKNERSSQNAGTTGENDPSAGNVETTPGVRIVTKRNGEESADVEVTAENDANKNLQLYHRNQRIRLSVGERIRTGLFILRVSR